MLAMFRGKPRMTVLLSSWLDEFQSVEDALYSVYFDRALQNSTATGDLLEKLGKIVGQGSEGLVDAQFSILIQARIQANRSDGRRAQLISIAQLLAPGLIIEVKDLPPASVYVHPRGALILPPVLVGRDFLASATAAGVLLIFVWTAVSAATTLTLGSVDVAVAVPTIDQALASVDVAVTTGGELAGAVQIQGGVA